MVRNSIAVIGSGISGLSCAWLLAKSHDVVLLERDGRLGGHSNTVEVDEGGHSVAVDTGFIVYNTASYPNLIALFAHLSVTTAPTRMTFTASLDGGAYEYSGSGLQGMFGQPANALKPAHWRMVRDILRFFREADALTVVASDETISLGSWLAARNYSREFVDRHILPMAAAIWSAPADLLLAYPAAAFARFFANHGLLQVRNRPQWRTVQGGSREYVSRLLADFDGEVVRGNGAARVDRRPDRAVVTLADGTAREFDQVVLACHADDALALLADAAPRERALLGAFRYAANTAVLHRDRRLMPRRRRLWASWNYIGAGGKDALCVTYWMNSLQPLQTGRDYFVTLNPTVDIIPETIVRREQYQHPLFDAGALAAQRELWSIQGRQRTWFAGSYCGSGFHEDGLQAGLWVAEQLGGLKRPWQVANESGRIVTGPVGQGLVQPHGARASGHREAVS